MTTSEGPDDTRPTGLEWVARFADALGVEPPADADLALLLDLAGVAAHSSERLAAPIACYLVGRAGLPPEQALDLARSLTGPPPG